MSQADREVFLSKPGPDQLADKLELKHEHGRPHAMATYLFWAFVSQEAKSDPSVVKPWENQDDGFIAPELMSKASQQASMAELWLSAVEHQKASPTPEQWARFRDMGSEAQKLCFSLLSLKKANDMMGGIEDEALLTTHFESQLRQLFVPY